MFSAPFSWTWRLPQLSNGSPILTTQRSGRIKAKFWIAAGLQREVENRFGGTPICLFVLEGPVMSQEQGSTITLLGAEILDVSLESESVSKTEAAGDSQGSSTSTSLCLDPESDGTLRNNVSDGGTYFDTPSIFVKADGSWCADTNTLTEDCPPPKLFEASNPKLGHFFIRHLVDNLEDCSHGMASKYFFKGKLESYRWIAERFQHEPRLKHLMSKPWTESPNRIELDHWALFFVNAVSFWDIPVVHNNPILKETRLTTICEALRKLRGTAIHRYPLTLEDVHLAMKLPALFGDDEQAAELQRVYGLVDNFSQLDDYSKEKLEGFLYDRPISKAYQVLDKVQSILEYSCFRHESSLGSEWLTHNGWEAPEQVELIKWEEHWDVVYRAKDTNGPHPSHTKFELSAAIAGVRKLRIAAAHRLGMTAGEFQVHIQAARDLVMIFEDTEQEKIIRNLASNFLGRDIDDTLSNDDEEFFE